MCVHPSFPSSQFLLDFTALVGDMTSELRYVNPGTQSPQQNWSRVKYKNQARWPESFIVIFLTTELFHILMELFGCKFKAAAKHDSIYKKTFL